MAAARALRMDGEALPHGTWVVVMSPVALSDGRQLAWHPPQRVAFSLVEARKLCRRAAPKRRNIMGSLVRRPDDDRAYMPANSRAALDVVTDLWSAVLHSMAAIEAAANGLIDGLPDGTTVPRGDGEVVSKERMVRRLNLDEKLSLVVPLAGGPMIKGTRPWELYVRVKGLRDDLVHVKEDHYDPDPEVRSAYDRLLVGDADDCAGDAFAVVQAIRPGFLGVDVVAVFEK